MGNKPALFQEKFVSKGPVDSKSASVQVMAWRRTCCRPLPEPVNTQLNDTHCRHPASMSQYFSKNDIPNQYRNASASCL